MEAFAIGIHLPDDCAGDDDGAGDGDSKRVQYMWDVGDFGMPHQLLDISVAPTVSITCHPVRVRVRMP